MTTPIEKILIALEKGDPKEDPFRASFEQTQAGLVLTTGNASGHINRLVNMLENDGLIFSDKRHVEKKKRKMKVYFLTEAGRTELQQMRETGVISESVVHANQMPIEDNFIGREGELAEFKDWLNAPGSRALVIKGIAGIGKSTLVSKAVEKHAGDKNLFWYRFSEWGSLKHLLLRLSDFLNALDRRGLASYLRDKETMDVSELSFILEKELQNLEALLVFDDYQKAANEEIQSFFGSLLDILPKFPMLKMVVIGREVPRFSYDIRDIELGTVNEITLSGLNKDETKKYLESKRIKAEEHEKIFDMTMGHPLALALIKTEGRAPSKPIKEYLGEEIISKLTYEERTILEVASLFRQPAPPTAYIEVAGPIKKPDTEEPDRPISILSAPKKEKKEELIPYDIVVSLAKKSLLYIAGENYGVHDLIRSFCYARIPSFVRKDYHQRIAKYILEEHSEDPAMLLEAIYHHEESKDFKEASRLVVKHGQDITRAGYMQEMLEIIESIPFEDAEPEHRPRILMLKGYIHETLSEIEKAIGNYMPAVTLFEMAEDLEGKVEAHLAIGYLMSKMSRWDESLANYKTALEISEDTDDLKGMSGAHKGIGQIYIRSGDIKRAMPELEKALKYAEQNNDKIMIAKIYGDMGLLNNYRDIFDKAIEFLDKARIIKEELNERSELNNIYNNIGVAYAQMRDFDKATRWLEKSIEASEAAGEIRNITYGLSNAAELYLSSNDLDKAYEYCERAAEIVEKLNEKDMEAYIQMIFGMIFHKKKEWGKAEEKFREALKLVAMADVVDTTAQVHLHYAQLLVDMKRKDEAMENFRKALAIWKRLENSPMEEAVEKEMNALLD